MNNIRKPETLLHNGAANISYRVQQLWKIEQIKLFNLCIFVCAYHIQTVQYISISS